MTDSLETLLRESKLKHGRICLYTQDGEWYASVTHFSGHQTHNVRPKVGPGLKFGWHVDPVDALRATLIEDDWVSRDMERRYAAAPKLGDTPAVDADGFCMICEGGGCDACRPAVDDEFEDLFA